MSCKMNWCLISLCYALWLPSQSSLPSSFRWTPKQLFQDPLWSPIPQLDRRSFGILVCAVSTPLSCFVKCFQLHAFRVVFPHVESASAPGYRWLLEGYAEKSHRVIIDFVIIATTATLDVHLIWKVVCRRVCVSWFHPLLSCHPLCHIRF